MDVTAALLDAARRAADGRLVESFDEREIRLTQSSLLGGEGSHIVANGEGDDEDDRTQRQCVCCRTEFARESLRVASRIARTRKDVLDVVAVYGDLHSGESRLTEEQRDEFDARIAAILDNEQKRIMALAEEVGVGPGSVSAAGSLQAHRTAVVQSLLDAKQELTNIVSELQLLRVRQTLASKAALFNADSETICGGEYADFERLVEEDAARERQRTTQRKQNKDKENGKENGIDGNKGLSAGDRLRNRKIPTAPVSKASLWQVSDLSPEDDEDEELDVETMNQLEQEQSTLAAQLHEEMQQARLAEKQIHEFSELAEMFSQKLFEQHNDIISLESDVMQSTEFMHRAGEELISAKEYNKSFRKYVIVFFTIVTLSLFIMDRMD